MRPGTLKCVRNISYYQLLFFFFELLLFKIISFPGFNSCLKASWLQTKLLSLHIWPFGSRPRFPSFLLYAFPGGHSSLGKCCFFSSALKLISMLQFSGPHNSLAEPDQLSSWQSLHLLGPVPFSIPRRTRSWNFSLNVCPSRAESAPRRFLAHTGNQKLSESSHRTFPDLWIFRARRSCFSLHRSLIPCVRGACVHFITATPVPMLSNMYVGYSVYIHPGC